MAKPKEAPHLRVRLAPQLLARLEKSREKTGRTLTGEITARLESSFRREDHDALVFEAVEKALKVLEAAAVARAAAPPPQPTPPSYSGILGQLTRPARDDVPEEPTQPITGSEKEEDQ